MVRLGNGPPRNAYTVLSVESVVKESRRPHQCNLCEHAPFSKKESYDKHWKREHQQEDTSSRNLLNFAGWRRPLQSGSEAVATSAAEAAAAPATAPGVTPVPVTGARHSPSALWCRTYASSGCKRIVSRNSDRARFAEHRQHRGPRQTVIT